MINRKAAAGVTVKMCPCCKLEEPTKHLHTVADYEGNALKVDYKGRLLVICEECKLQFGWTWEAY